MEHLRGLFYPPKERFDSKKIFFGGIYLLANERVAPGEPGRWKDMPINMPLEQTRLGAPLKSTLMLT